MCAQVNYRLKTYCISQANQGESAEVRIAKVAITNVCLWIFTWTPYATVVMIGCFGNRSLVSPLVSALPAFLAKTASCFNPIGIKASLKNTGLLSYLELFSTGAG